MTGVNAEDDVGQRARVDLNNLKQPPT